MVLPDFRRWGGILGSVNLGNVWVPKWIPGLPHYNPSVVIKLLLKFVNGFPGEDDTPSKHTTVDSRTCYEAYSEMFDKV